MPRQMAGTSVRNCGEGGITFVNSLVTPVLHLQALPAFLIPDRKYGRSCK
jgi:hypothetical protein